MSKPNRPRTKGMLLELIHYLELENQELLEQINGTFDHCKLNGCPLDERNQCLPGHCALTEAFKSSDSND
jgi:hypothetical protein